MSRTNKSLFQRWVRPVTKYASYGVEYTGTEKARLQVVKHRERIWAVLNEVNPSAHAGPLLLNGLSADLDGWVAAVEELGDGPDVTDFVREVRVLYLAFKEALNRLAGVEWGEGNMALAKISYHRAILFSDNAMAVKEGKLHADDDPIM